MKAKIPTILAILILIVAVAAGVFFVQSNQIFRIGASPDTTPNDVKVTNITDTGVTISWVTDKTTVGTVSWGTTQSNLGNTPPSTDLSGQNIHFLNITGLTAQQTYYFKITSDGTTYDNSGIPWQFSTGPTLTGSGSSTVASGSVLTATGQPAMAIVYISGGAISPVSAQTTANGSWVIPLSTARSNDLTTLAIFNQNTTLQIFVQGGPSGVASAQATGDSLTAIPQMVLGQTYNFTNQTATNSGELPNANLNLPNEATPASKFEVGSATGSATKKTVVLNSITNNETVNTTTPEVFGQGPAGTKITITIHSTATVSGTTTVDASGNWNWTPPTGLTPGTHTITLSWKDASGVLQTLTRTFVVQAAEGPAFVATPSASPLITLPTQIATPTATPRFILPSTTSGVPTSGVGTPTILGVGLGVILIIGSVILAL